MIVFEPSFQNFRSAILAVYELMVLAVNNMQRLESKLNPDAENAQEMKVSSIYGFYFYHKLYLAFSVDFYLYFLQPIIDEEYIDANKIRVLATLEEQRIGPELRVQDFDEYIDLINGNTQDQIDAFLAEPHDFDCKNLFCFENSR